MPKALIVASALVLAVLGAFALATAKPVAACSLARASLDLVASHAEIVIVGEVIDEQILGERATVPVYSPYYESTIRVVAVLEGNPERVFTLAPLGFLGADCSGGPRLPAGERVLLFLGPALPGQPSQSDLRVYGYEDGKYVLTAGRAKTMLDPPISAEDALRRVAAITGAPPEQLEAALAFARGEPTPAPQPDMEAVPAEAEEDGGPPTLLIGLAAAGGAAVLFAVSVGLWRLRRAR